MTVRTCGSNRTRRRAADAFRRSVALDSNTAALGHLLEVALLDGDTASVRRLGALYLARDTSGELLGFYRWRIAEGLGDDSTLAALRAEYRRMPLLSLWRLMNYAVLDGRRLEDADSAAVAIRAVAGRSSDWQRSKTYLHAYEVNRGRPAAALADTAGSDETEYGPHAALYQRVLDALYGDGDSVSGGAGGAGAGAEQRRRSDDRADRPLRGDPLAAEPRRARWRRPGHRPAPSTARPPTRLSRSQPAPSAPRCSRRSSPRPRTRRARAPRWIGWTALIRSGPGGQRNGPAVAFTLSPAYVRSTIGISPVAFEDFVNLDLARLRERQGDLRAALTAVRRRSYSYHLSDYLAPHLREEGRLAALTGDSAGAVRAYRHYLALRSDPEPSVRPAVDSVRAGAGEAGRNPLMKPVSKTAYYCCGHIAHRGRLHRGQLRVD